MPMKKILAAVAAAFCAIAGTAHAADDSAPRVFRPTSPWALDYGDDYCRLARNFSDGTDEISLAMDRIQPSLFTRMIVAGDAAKPFRKATMLGYRYLPSGEERKTMLLRSKTADGTQFLIIYPAVLAPPPKFGEPPQLYSREAEQQFAGGVNGLILTEGLNDAIQIETGNLKPVIVAMQECTDDLLKTWGLDAAKHQGETRQVLPDGDTSKWLPQGTIGFGDFAKLSGGTNQVQLMVDATGKPTDCKIFYPTLEKETNDKVCAALKENAQFTPALDADGKPFASYYMTSPLFLFGPPSGGGFGRR